MDLAAYNFSFYVIYIVTDKKWRELTIISGMLSHGSSQFWWLEPENLPGAAVDFALFSEVSINGVRHPVVH
jgi:hypothetical protein